MEAPRFSLSIAFLLVLFASLSVTHSACAPEPYYPGGAATSPKSAVATDEPAVQAMPARRPPSKTVDSDVTEATDFGDTETTDPDVMEIAESAVSESAEPAEPAEPTSPKSKASRPTSGRSGNPIAGHQLYINPSFIADLDVSIATAASGSERDNLKAMRGVASAYWLDVKTKVVPDNDTTTSTAAGILKDAAGMRPVPLVTLIVYDLPNRDCHAKASNGEICCTYNADGTCDYLAAGECEDGLSEYMTTYIDQLAVSIKEYCGKVPMAFVIEPDSLPNLVTNMDDPKCGSAATSAAYRKGIPYAVKTLAAACSSAALYLDAAHGGWLGWEDNNALFSTEVKDLEVSPFLRGFATNVANYNAIGVMCPSVGFCLEGQNPDHECCKDPCGLSSEFNPAHNEMNYVMALKESMQKEIPTFEPHFLIDTGRNGVAGTRSSCSNWCNIREAGVGVSPTTETADQDMVDAYMWLKTPGESDGCTETLPDGDKCPRFDADCASVDSLGTEDSEPRVPEAGGWFDYQVKMLARNGQMSL